MSPIDMPEWAAEAAREPYRIAVYVKVGGRGRARPYAAGWTVYDCRPEDAPTVAGPFATREAAIARADDLNRAAR